MIRDGTFTILTSLLLFSVFPVSTAFGQSFDEIISFTTLYSSVSGLVSRELSIFFNLDDWLIMLTTGNYSRLATWEGLKSAIGPILPVLLVIEIIRLLWRQSFRVRDYRMMFLVYMFNRLIGTWVSIGLAAFVIGLLAPIAPFQLDLSWYGLIYGYLIWELAHYVYHYLAHKIRILWCLHSVHHAPEDMNLLVGRTRFFLEGPYADLIRISLCIILGLSPPLLMTIVFIDSFWGWFIHAGEAIIRNGRMGWLGRFILTPSHHRAHHSKHPLYLDTNFCNLLKVWDWVFGTLQEEDPTLSFEFGLRRKIDAGSFLDVYFGEIVLLARDVWAAPGFLNKLLYVFMQPGWQHTGDHETAWQVRQTYLKENQLITLETSY